VSALGDIVERARRGATDRWTAGPLDAATAARFAAASGDHVALAELARPHPLAPLLLLPSVLDWGIGSDQAVMRPDGMSPREAPYVDGADVRLVHGGMAIRWYRHPRIGDDGIAAGRSARAATLRTGRRGEVARIDLRTRYVDRGGPVASVDESLFCLSDIGPDDGAVRPAPEFAADAPADVIDRFDAVRLSRFSAACWNSHRIHLDADFARHEGFSGPVVQSTLHGVMVQRAAAAASGRRDLPIELSWRNLAVVVAGQTVRSAAWPENATPAADGVRFAAVEWDDRGVVTARGIVRYSPDGPLIGPSGYSVRG